MSTKSFFNAEVRSEAAAAVKEVEAQSSAEMVIAVRLRSGSYRHCDYLVGFLLALAALWGILLVPEPFRPATVVLDLALAFGLGAFVSSRSPFLERLFASRASKREQVQTSARAAFYDLRVSHTHGRTGVLVYVSLLERRAEVLCDSGVERALLGEAWERALTALGSAVRSQEPKAVFEAVRALGPLLAASCPRRAGDVNELPDEMSAP